MTATLTPTATESATLTRNHLWGADRLHRDLDAHCATVDGYVARLDPKPAMGVFDPQLMKLLYRALAVAGVDLSHVTSDMVAAHHRLAARAATALAHRYAGRDPHAVGVNFRRPGQAAMQGMYQLAVDRASIARINASAHGQLIPVVHLGVRELRSDMAEFLVPLLEQMRDSIAA